MVRTSKTLFLLITITLTTTTIQSLKPSTDNVIFIVELARHGARAPIHHVYDVDWVKEAGVGELTPVGQRQRYLLGLNTKTRYKAFFDDTLKFNEYWVRSTFFNRTIMSGFSHIVGIFNGKDAHDLQFDNTDKKLFPPQDLLINPGDLQFKTPLPHAVTPFPIHSILSTMNDQQLYLDGPPCPKNNEQVLADLADAEKRLKTEPKFVELLKKTYERYNLDKDWGSDVSDTEKCFRLGDFAIMDYLNNKEPKINPETEKEYYSLLERCYSLKIFHSFAHLKTAKVAVTPVLGQIKDWFNTKTKKTKEEFPLRYVQYSAHDDTVSAHMRVLNLFNSECTIEDLKNGKISEDCPNYPPVASQILWELIKVSENNSYAVKVSFNGVYVDYCKTGRKMGEDFFCTLEEFTKIIEDGTYTEPQYEEFCGFKNNSGNQKDEGKGRLVFVLSGMVLFLTIVSLVLGISMIRYKSMLEKGGRGGDGRVRVKDEVSSLDFNFL